MNIFITYRQHVQRRIPFIAKGKYHINTIDHLISHRTVFVSLIYTFSPYNGVIPCDTISESSLLVAMYTVVVIGHVVYFFSTPSRFSIIAKVKPSFLIGPVYFHGVKYFRRIMYRGLLTSHTFASIIIFYTFVEIGIRIIITPISKYK